jgi:SAM-dependent methyltransferase
MPRHGPGSASSSDVATTLFPLPTAATTAKSANRPTRTSAATQNWVAELAGLLQPRARVLDLGCGAGIPATRELTDPGLLVIGFDFSPSRLAPPGPPARPGREPAASRHDRTALQACEPGRRRVLLRADPCSARRPAGPVSPYPPLAAAGGYFLVFVSATQWTGTERYLGADML